MMTDNRSLVHIFKVQLTSGGLDFFCFLCMISSFKSKDKSKGDATMRNFIVLLCSFFLIVHLMPTGSLAAGEKQALIIEVEGNPDEHQTYIERYFPEIDVVQTYDVLFQGIALKVSPRNFKKLRHLSFIKTVHPVQTYETQLVSSPNQLSNQLSVLPDALHETPYTGKGIKVGVIDTGIDYTHPDLMANYAGGYDLVDLDEDPMETKGEQGIATSHGTHVAGIIAANGKLQGVAPEANIYAYRALGPGGVGSSVHVIAALEQAVKDDIDVVNLSLGNAVNGPDYPTSMAVNRAVDLGVAVVIANGNNGPDLWSIGAPATATKALSVGATTPERTTTRLDIGLNEADIPLTEMHGSIPWRLKKGYPVVNLKSDEPLAGKIVLAERGETSFLEKAQQAEQAGATALIIYNHNPDPFEGSIADDQTSIHIPVATISRENGLDLKENLKEKAVYAQSKYEQVDMDVAPYSSRGPVAVNWNIKPDIMAPGTNIVSTVPGGYQTQQGTSMAAPHVTGAIALLKEAHPYWTNEQIIGALKTTARSMETMTSEQIEPISQGMGDMDIGKALDTTTIIMNPLLSFGKINAYRQSETIELAIENTTTQDQQYHFSLPKKQPGLVWDLPQTFKVKAKERKKVPVTLHVTTPQLKEDIHQGRLMLEHATEQFHLPYLFVNKTADHPRAMGLEFDLKMFESDTYVYKLYVTDHVEEISVELYDPDTLLYNRQLLTIDNPVIGTNEGEMKPAQVGKPGYYMAFINVILQDGTFESYQTDLHIPKE